MKALLKISLFISFSALAGVLPGSAWEGRVISWDNETVILKNGFRKISVARTEFGNYKLKEQQFVRVENGTVTVMTAGSVTYSISSK